MTIMATIISDIAGTWNLSLMLLMIMGYIIERLDSRRARRTVLHV